MQPVTGLFMPISAREAQLFDNQGRVILQCRASTIKHYGEDSQGRRCAAVAFYLKGGHAIAGLSLGEGMLFRGEFVFRHEDITRTTQLIADHWINQDREDEERNADLADDEDTQLEPVDQADDQEEPESAKPSRKKWTPPAYPSRVRFWVWHGGDYVRLTLRSGHELTYGYGGPTDEGYSRTSHHHVYDGGVVTYTQHTSGRDCDGYYETTRSCHCPHDELTALRRRIVTVWEPAWHQKVEPWPVPLPNWRKGESHQRDYSAEAAGY